MLKEEWKSPEQNKWHFKPCEYFSSAINHLQKRKCKNNVSGRDLTGSARDKFHLNSISTDSSDSITTKILNFIRPSSGILRISEYRHEFVKWDSYELFDRAFSGVVYGAEPSERMGLFGVRKLVCWKSFKNLEIFKTFEVLKCELYFWKAFSW